MRRWLRSNWWAFVVIAVMVVLIATTVTYRQWSRQIGFKQPQQVVAAGQWGDVLGARWRLSPVTVTAPTAPPPGGRLASFLLEREVDRRPAGLPNGFQFCTASMVDGPRRWTTTATDFGVFQFAYREHYTTRCSEDGPLLVAMYVPAGVTISAVEVLFQPGAVPPPGAETDANAPVYETSDESPVVVRFQTG